MEEIRVREDQVLTREESYRNQLARRNPRTAVPAYADAWALNYYLIRYRPDEYVNYVEALSKMAPLTSNTPEERIAEFREHFGDLTRLEEDFLRRMSDLD